MMKVISDLEQRLRRAFIILFDDRDKILKEIEEIKKRVEGIEQRFSNRMH